MPAGYALNMRISSELAGQRLDKVLVYLLEASSLRHRRRLVEQGHVLVDGKQRTIGYKLRAGQEVELNEPALLTPDGEVEILCRQGEYAAVLKPVGVHSALVRGSNAPSVEGMLAGLFPDETPLLLNRLDLPTSGFVLVAFSQVAANRFRELEKNGQVRKEYLAVVHGRLEGSKVIRNALDMAKSKKVKVLSDPDPDPARHTHATPLSYAQESDTTLVQAIIARGVRHQIRAHLAAIGHPILGDKVYGSGGEQLFLHHCSLDFEGFSVDLEPSWVLPD